MDNTRYTTVIFDFDFTLADASDGIAACYNHAFSEMGLPSGSREEICRMVGQTLNDGYRILTGDPDEDAAKRFRAFFSAKADEVMTASTILFPDTLAVLQALKAKGIHTGIVTTKNRGRIQEALDKFDAAHLIGHIVGYEDVKNAKPNPEGLLLCVKSLGAEARHILYAGDHTIDAQAARNASVDFIAVTTGTTEAEAFEAYPRIAVCKSLTEIMPYIT